MNPEIENLRRLKYEIMEVDMNSSSSSSSASGSGAAKDDGDEQDSPNPITTISTLVQKYASLSKMQNPIGKPPQVVKYSP